jgi:hypothetical protein
MREVEGETVNNVGMAFRWFLLILPVYVYSVDIITMHIV